MSFSGRIRHLDFIFCAIIATLLLHSNALCPQTDVQTESAKQIEPLYRLVRANSLAIKGKQPFHIKLTFQLYDLAGQKSEPGAIEEWWQSSGRHKVSIDAPSLHVVSPLKPGTEFHVNRESYLSNLLLQAFVRPINRDLNHSGSTLEETLRMEGPTLLKCISLQLAGSPVSVSHLPENCTEPGSDVLRLQTGEGEMLIGRELQRSFHTTDVASSVTISYSNRLAITGVLTALEDLAQGDGSIDSPENATTDDIAIDSTAMAGSKLTSKTPTYPKLARAAHLQGSVALAAIITKDGTLRDLDVIATPDAMFSKSAMEAVNTWTYKPYLLKDKPTEVETTIYVNYALGRKK